MPVIIYIYLAANIALTLYAYKYCYFEISRYCEILEGFSITAISIILTLAYYYPSISDFLGIYIFIPVAIGISYHFYYRHSYIYEPEDDVEDPKEKVFHKYFNVALITFNSLIILPAYILGILTGVKYV